MTIGLFDRRRTILLVDADPHARAALRVALEAADFSVGEAANDREGERTALRIKPDAIIAELIFGCGRCGHDDRREAARRVTAKSPATS